MKLLNIALIQSCNYDLDGRPCRYCSMKRWLYPLDHVWDDGSRANSITNEALLGWLGRNVSPNEWLIKLTGGEPGLYPEIQTLVPALADMGFHGMIETNGSLPIPQSDNFVRLAAWHEGRPLPKYFDVILIIKNTTDDWEAKIRYCEEKGFRRLITEMGGPCAPKTVEERVELDMKRPPTEVEAILMMNSSGGLQICPVMGPPYGDIFSTDTVMEKRVTDAAIAGEECLRCAQTRGVDLLFPELLGHKVLGQAQ